jgi:hypothetical protein
LWSSGPFRDIPESAAMELDVGPGNEHAVISTIHNKRGQSSGARDDIPPQR